MLIALLEISGKGVGAHLVAKADGPFVCPSCKCSVVVKKGRIVIHHFAHKSDAGCPHGRGETELHRRAKLEIYEALSEVRGVQRVQMEYVSGSVRADVMAWAGGRKIAIEAQRSHLQDRDFQRRTEEYDRQGIPVLWIALSDLLPGHQKGTTFRPKGWEWWMHVFNGGVVYYWAIGQHVVPVHYGNPGWRCVNAVYENGDYSMPVIGHDEFLCPPTFRESSRYGDYEPAYGYRVSPIPNNRVAISALKRVHRLDSGDGHPAAGLLAQRPPIVPLPQAFAWADGMPNFASDVSRDSRRSSWVAEAETSHVFTPGRARWDD